MFIKVPQLLPKYIIEPVACAINIAKSCIPDDGQDILLLGSGFLSTVIYTMLNRWYENTVIVIGNSNKEFWSKQDNAKLLNVDDIIGRKFKYIIDVSEKPEYLNLNFYAERANIVLAAEKHPAPNVTFGQFLWNAVNIKFPSPRNSTFIESMLLAEELITCGNIDVEALWTKSYNREIEVELAFMEGVNRPVGYGRGYIEWQK